MKTAISPINRIGFVLFPLGAIWAAAHGQWVLAAALAAAAAWGVWAALGARRGRLSELTRLDAGQPSDERDQNMLDRSLAAVGVFAIGLELAQFLYWAGAGRTGDQTMWSGIRLAALSIVWIVANRVVLHRGNAGA
mgnify:CR=1 FL=1